MTESVRGAFMQAAKESLAAMHPHRLVFRGVPDPARLGNENLKAGVFSLLATDTRGWTDHTGREGQYGQLNFVVLADALVTDIEDGQTEAQAAELLEELLEAELLAWVQAIKPTPLDAIYPVESVYSGGLEAPNAWVVMKLQAMYV